MKPIRGVQLNRENLLARGLVGCWLHNEQTGLTTWDYSGNGYMGTLVNSPTWGEGVDLESGSSQYITMGDVLNFEYNEPFSIVTRIKPESLGTGRAIVGKMESSGNYRGWMLLEHFTYNNRLNFYMRNDNSPSYQCAIRTDACLSAGTWTHIVATYDGSTDVSGMHIYIDGVPIGLTTEANTLGNRTTVNSNPLCLGARNAASLYFDGIIDYVMLYDRELFDEDAKSLYRDSFQMFGYDDFPAWLYVEAGAPPSISIPVVIHHLRMAGGL